MYTEHLGFYFEAKGVGIEPRDLSLNNGVFYRLSYKPGLLFGYLISINCILIFIISDYIHEELSWQMALK